MDLPKFISQETHSVSKGRCEGWDKRPGVFRGKSFLMKIGVGKKRSIPHPTRGRPVSSMKKAELGIMARWLVERKNVGVGR